MRTRPQQKFQVAGYIQVSLSILDYLDSPCFKKLDHDFLLGSGHGLM